MEKALIVHGVGGHPGENWFPWLKKELEKLGIRVFVPQFPTPKKQELGEWMKVFEGIRNELGENPILVGHSLGAPFLLNILETNKAKCCFLVAGFTGVAGNEFDPGMKSFAQREFNWEKIRENCPVFCVFHSDSDPYIKLEKGQELAEKLGAELALVMGAGHFNEKAGYVEFKLLLEKIKKELGR